MYTCDYVTMSIKQDPWNYFYYSRNKKHAYWEICEKWSWLIAWKQPGRCRGHISLHFLSHGAATEVSSPALLPGVSKTPECSWKWGQAVFWFAFFSNLLPVQNVLKLHFRQFRQNTCYYNCCDCRWFWSPYFFLT